MCIAISRHRVHALQAHCVWRASQPGGPILVSVISSLGPRRDWHANVLSDSDEFWEDLMKQLGRPFSPNEVRRSVLAAGGCAENATR